MDILKSRDPRRIYDSLSMFSCMKTLSFVLRDLFPLPTPKNHKTSYIRFCFSYSLKQKHFPLSRLLDFRVNTLYSQSKATSDLHQNEKIPR